MTTYIIILVTAILAGVAILLLKRKSTLPPHLAPHFKNGGEFNDFIKDLNLENEQRRKELVNPTNAKEAAEYLALNGCDIKNKTSQSALVMVEDNLSDSPVDYGELLGEIYALSNFYKNLEKAYFYYHIAFSQKGYSTDFKDENNDPPNYCGPIDDFRNESYISEIIEELGFDKIKEIDLKAKEWLGNNI